MPLCRTASGNAPELLPVMCPRLVIPDHPFIVVTLKVVVALFSSFNGPELLLSACVPSQLFHGAGAVLPALPRFRYTDLVCWSATVNVMICDVDFP